MYEDMERVRIGATVHHDSSIVAIFLKSLLLMKPGPGIASDSCDCWSAGSLVGNDRELFTRL
jgi:hypothetical protein